MSTAYSKIKAGLDDASAYLEGRTRGARTHRIRVSDPDVAAIRAKAGLSQRDFAESIGVAVGTLQGWEQGRRRPDGPVSRPFGPLRRRRIGATLCRDPLPGPRAPQTRGTR